MLYFGRILQRRTTISEMASDCDNASTAGSEDTVLTPAASTSLSMKSLLKGDLEDAIGLAECIEVECGGIKTQVYNTMSCAETTSKLELRNKYICCSSICQCVWGVFLIIFGILSFLYTPLDVMMREKLHMRPGMPPYEWWAHPPDELILRVYVFNVTNHERFLAGLDRKLNYEEIGPVVYLEKITHENIEFHLNSTMTYTVTRKVIYLPERNHVDLNATLITPNLAVLGMASYLHNSPYFVNIGFRMLVRSHGSTMFLRRSIYQYIWDYREPVLDTSKNLVPGMVPVNNMGMLSRIYTKFVENVTVYIGPKWGNNKFFTIVNVGGKPQLPGFDYDTCPDRLYGSSEGVLYPQYLNKNDVLLYWRKSVCKIMPLYFDKEIVVDDVPVFRYNLSENVYDRVRNGTDCYDTSPSLPAGVSDASKCYFDFPMVVSYPHFYTGHPPKDYYVTGLKPDRNKHNSYVIVEPVTGTPFRQVARMQSNVLINDLSGFGKEYDKFSNLVLPLFWGEYNQENLPKLIGRTIFFTVVVLPILSIVFSSFAIIAGLYLIIKPIYLHNLRNASLANLLPRINKCVTHNRIFNYERETFLRKPT